MNTPAVHPPGFAGRIAVLVALMTMLAPFSIDTYLPSFPDIAAEFGASHVQMQQTLSLYLAGFAVTTLIYGPLADAFGRRIVVLWATGLYALASLGCAQADSIGELLLFRITQGLTASAGLVVGRATVRDAFSGARAQQVMSNVMLLFSLAPAIAPIMGGWLHDWAGWRSVFWFLAGLGAVLWLFIFMRLPETLPPAMRHSIHPLAVGRVYGRTLRSGGFLMLIMMIALNFGGMFLYVAGAPVLIYEHLGLAASDFAVLFVPLVGGIMLGSFTTGRLAGRMAMERVPFLGYGLMLLAALLNLAQAHGLPGSIPATVAPIAVYAFGMALCMPSLSLLSLEYFPHNRGTASAVQGFLHTGGNALVAGLLVPVVTVSVATMALGMAVLHLLSLGLWLAWWQRARPALP